MKKIMYSFFTLVYAKSLLASKIIDTAPVDSMPSVIIQKLDGTALKGKILSYTTESITLKTTTMKETKKDVFRYPVVILYKDIKSVRILQTVIPRLLLSLSLLLLLYLLITGRWRPTDFENVAIIILSPLIFATTLVSLFRKKRFLLKGEKGKYMYFLSRLNKFI